MDPDNNTLRRTRGKRALLSWINGATTYCWLQIISLCAALSEGLLLSTGSFVRERIYFQASLTFSGISCLLTRENGCIIHVSLRLTLQVAFIFGWGRFKLHQFPLQTSTWYKWPQYLNEIPLWFVYMFMKLVGPLRRSSSSRSLSRSFVGTPHPTIDP